MGSLRRVVGGPARRLPAIVLPAGTCDRIARALTSQRWSAAPPLLRIFSASRFGIAPASLDEVSARERATTPLHARLRSLRKAPRGMVPARKVGSAASREAARNRRQHRYRGAPHGRLSDGERNTRGTGGRIHRRMRRRPPLRNPRCGDETLYGGVRDTHLTRW